MKKKINYIYSSDLNVAIRLRIVSLFEFMSNTKNSIRETSGCMLLKIAVFSNGHYIGREIQTSFCLVSMHTNCNTTKEIQKWNEWLTLPINYSELSKDATLCISLWDIKELINPVFLAYCSKKLFSKHGIYRSGQIDLKMRRIIQTSIDNENLNSNFCDKNMFYFNNSYKKVFFSLKNLEKNFSECDETEKKKKDYKMLIKKSKLYSNSLIDQVNWLDKITFSRIEAIKQEAKIEDRSLYLTVEMPNVYYLNDSIAYIIIFNSKTSKFFSNTTIPYFNSIQENKSFSQFNSKKVIEKNLNVWKDYELGLDNLCELKHHMLTRNARTNNIDKRLQPNTATKHTIETIINAPSLQIISVEERDLIWKFRFWLKLNPKALVKFIRSVNWEEEIEVKHAIQIIMEWKPIDACDALELLAPSFTHSFVRRYAVSRLQKTTYSNLLLYLPQLVQALRYETDLVANDIFFVAKNMTPINVSFDSDKLSCLTNQYQHLKISQNINFLQNQKDEWNSLSKSTAEFLGLETNLASFLIKSACENCTIANFLFWYLKVEIEANAEIDKPIAKMYSNVMDHLKNALAKGNFLARQTLTILTQQKKFVDKLVEMAIFVAEVNGSRAKKLELLKKKLAEDLDLLDLKGLSLPLDPSIHVKNIHAESTMLFSSNLMPMRLTFFTVRGSISPYECNETYTTIFKRGDDLRQDQLVIQMIRLMDSLLKEEKLDLCLTPYAVLATSVSEGFVQFIKATPIAELKSIQDTLRMFRPSSTGPFGIEADVLNNYVRSCAGYCVICYILGIGDRHLHNLLLCENGRMFHVDFGFILGRDPKPMPPPMKLTSEMVNAMGGQNSEYFKNFVDYITTSFCILRRHANLIINLFSLMLDSGIPDIAIEKEKAVQKVLERFHLQMTDESACQLMNRLIETSINAKMPIIVDFVHDVKQFISN